MTPGINIGNTLENTAAWETGWGNRPLRRKYVQSLARLGFKTVRLPVAWDTYADNGRITPQQFGGCRRWSTGSPGPGCTASLTSTGTAGGLTPA
jgi:hypothetical protein